LTGEVTHVSNLTGERQEHQNKATATKKKKKNQSTLSS
jgi:hypothetical protein